MSEDVEKPAKVAKTIPELVAEFAIEPKKWKLSSRNLMIALFYGVLKQKPPRTPKGKLPSVDEAALSKMKHPFPARLLVWRKAQRTISSLQSAQAFIEPEGRFTAGAPSPTGERAVFRFMTVGFDNIERVFALSKRSIPLNIDRKGRRAFVVPDTRADPVAVAADPRNGPILLALMGGGL